MIAKSVLEEAEKKQKKNKTATLQCIYGSEIKNPCPVRQDLESIEQDPLKKYKMPKNIGIEGFAELFSAMGEALHNKMTLLAEFCGHCPYLALFDDSKRHEYYANLRKRGHKTLKRKLPKK